MLNVDARFYAIREKLRNKLTRPEMMTWFSEGTVKPGHARVVQAFDLAEDSFWDDLGRPWLRQWFAERPTVSFQLAIPPDCPRYDPPTPEKERMVENIVRNMRNFMQWIVDHERARGERPSYPDKVTLVIANFNVEDDFTYVLIKEPHEV
ncbi:MAG: hypothetical protein N3C12_12725 [Candidatus Binatia bacterium]|nr:hypothetical protein [Candidatus Binatia bacterium]